MAVHPDFIAPFAGNRDMQIAKPIRKFSGEFRIVYFLTSYFIRPI